MNCSPRLAGHLRNLQAHFIKYVLNTLLTSPYITISNSTHSKAYVASRVLNQAREQNIPEDFITQSAF